MGADSLLQEIRINCLEFALDLLDESETPTAGTVGVIKGLIRAAIEIDALNLKWERKTINPEDLMRKVARSAIDDIQRASREQEQETSGQ